MSLADFYLHAVHYLFGTIPIEVRILRNKIRALALLNTLTILAGCGPDSPAPNPEVLAIVGDLEISASYVYEYQKKNRAAGRVWSTQLAVETLVDRELLLTEAKRKGFASDSTVVHKFQQRERSYLAEEMLRIEVAPRAKVTEEEILAEYESGGWKNQVLTEELYHISADTARSVYERIAAGGDFSVLALKYNQDRVFHIPAGYIGRQEYYRSDPPRAVVEAAFAAEVGEIIPPVFVTGLGGGGWVVARVIGRKGVDLSTVTAKIRKELYDERVEHIRSAYLLHLRDKFGLKVEDKGMNLLVEHITNSGDDGGMLDENALEIPIYSYADSYITVSQVLSNIGDISRLPGPVDAEIISTELKKRLLPETLLAYDAKAHGVDTTQTYNQWSRGQIDDLVLETYYKKIAGQVEAVPEQEIEEYYEEHKVKFRSPGRAEIFDILVRDLETAQQVKVAWERGDDFGELLAQYGVRDRGGDGRVIVYSSQGAIYGQPWVDAVMSAPLWTVMGPIQTQDYFSVFQVDMRQDEYFYGLELARVRNSVIRSIEEQNARNRFEKHMVELRDDMDDALIIFAKHFSLVDSLLAIEE